VELKEDVLTLTFGEFPEKYVYVDNYTVTCGEFTFKVTKETKTITPIADEFEQIREEASGGMDYNLFTPSNTGKAQPIVIAFHGYGDNENLYHNKLAVAWADPANQAVRPCYVLAPSFTNFTNTSYRKDVYEKVMAEVQEMVEAGKVDPNRIYVTGKSFGGAAVYEFLEAYPDAVAGAIAMCGAANYYGGYLFPQKAEDAAKLVDIPLWIAHATTDPTVGIDSSKNMYKMITEAGGTLVKFTEYSDAEMTAAGVTAAMSNHSMEAVVLEDETYLEWLFAQSNSAVTDVVANTVVEPAGQALKTLEVTVSDASLLEGIKADDFTFTGQANGWLTSKLHAFTGTVKEVAVKDNVVTLTVECPEKYCYVQSFAVKCNTNTALSFTNEMVSKTNTPIADEFEQIRIADGAAFDYNLYTPENTDEPQPIVIALHGYGDELNLVQNKLAVAWADPANQAERSCYVMAPLLNVAKYFDPSYRDGVYASMYEEIQKMIEDGKVDPERIYVTGKSFGGAAVYEFCAKYPEDVAAAIAMCGARSYLGVTDEAIEKMVDIPLWLAHAESDNTVPVSDSQSVYDVLVNAGSELVKFTKFSDEDLAAAGVTAAMGPHSSEAVVLEDESYMEWLFSHPVQEELPEDNTDDVVPGDDADKDADKDADNKAEETVKTGDEAPVGMLSMVTLLSVMLMAVIVFRKRMNR